MWEGDLPRQLEVGAVLHTGEWGDRSPSAKAKVGTVVEGSKGTGKLRLCVCASV